MSKTTSKNRRKIAERKGKHAETIAVWWLRLHGYRIIARRVKTPKGEIDIIARRGKYLVFAEVKARADFSLAISSVTLFQVKRIVAGANYWLAQQKDVAQMHIRFDIILVKPYLLIKHLKNAFAETGLPI